jgi:hypothetical protein
MEAEKSFWEQIAALGAGIFNNKLNNDAAVAQSANLSQAVSGIVRFGIVLAAVYFGVSLIVSLFKRKR